MAEEGQEVHSLPGAEHDGTDRELAALAKIRTHIMSLVDRSDAAFQVGRPETGGFTQEMLKAQSIRSPFWVAHYGTIQIEVWEPLFLMGQVAHVIQDSFAHAYRSDDACTIYAITNDIETMDGTHLESRDGPKHSDALDDGTLPEVKDLTDAASTATQELFLASRQYFSVSPENATAKAEARQNVVSILDKWMSLEEGCGYDANYCDSKWADLARRDETGPVLGCSAMQTRAGFGLVVVVIGIAAWRKRRDWSEAAGDKL